MLLLLFFNLPLRFKVYILSILAHKYPSRVFHKTFFQIFNIFLRETSLQYISLYSERSLTSKSIHLFSCEVSILNFFQLSLRKLIWARKSARSRNGCYWLTLVSFFCLLTQLFRVFSHTKCHYSIMVLFLYFYNMNNLKIILIIYN